MKYCIETQYDAFGQAISADKFCFESQDAQLLTR